MKLDQAMENIKRFAPKFAKEEVLCIREHKEEAIPLLVSYLRESLDSFYAADPESLYDNPDDFDDQTYAIFLLAEFKVNEAFESFIRILELDSEKCDFLIGDVLTGDMGSLIASVALPSDIERIKTVLENDTLNEFHRGAALSALVIMYVSGVYEREDFFNYLGLLLKKCEDNLEVVTFIAYECSRVCAEEHFTRIIELFENDKIDTSFIGIECFTNNWDYKNADEALAGLKEDKYYQLMCDTEKAMCWWDCFNEKSTQSAIAKVSVVPKKKIGRNEFCPCGSGKKYKKCCIDKDLMA